MSAPFLQVPILERLSAPADEVLNWNAIAQITTLPSAPPMASRNMAITQSSVFDAVNAIVRRYAPYAVNSRNQPTISGIQRDRADRMLPSRFASSKCLSAYSSYRESRVAMAAASYARRA